MKLNSVYKRFPIILFVSVFLIGLGSCAPDEITEDDQSGDISEETLVVNEWINNNMKEYYLWNTEIPSSVNYEEESDPAELFKKMLYTDEDKWSWITDDWSSLKDELEGTPVSMGFAPAFFYKDEGSTDVITIVEYVYKDSPADEAGLERGDIILTYDGEVPNDENYYDLYSGDSYTVGLGTFSSEDESFSSSGESIDLVATSFDANPVLHYEVKNIDEYNIGYLVYSDFTGGVNDTFLDSIDNVMDYFQENSVTDVIVDLRYNPGGELEAASHLASALAPASAVTNEDILIKMTYNSILQDYFEQQEDDSYLNYRFPSNNSNLDLSKVYFLTTDKTASASELVIAGLKPYMDVVMVGDTTSGKYVGAWAIHETHNWCMLPIVLKYANANDYTDFKEGIAPDVYVYDYLIPAYEFGDLNDEVLAAAIEQITGTTLSTSKSARIRPGIKELFPKKMDIRKTLIVPNTSTEGSE